MNLDYEQLRSLGVEYGVPLVKALLILALGWLVAKGAAYATRKLLGKTELDNKLAAYLTGGRTEGLAIEPALAKFAYWLVMLFVLMAVFESLKLTVVTEPINALVTKLFAFAPRLLAAGVLVAVAWAVASVLKMVFANLLGAFDIDRKLGESAGEETKNLSLAATLADAVYYLVFLLFLPQVLDALQMEGLSPVKDMVASILGFLPSLFGAVVIFLIFYLVARIVQRLVTNLLAGVGFDRLPQWLGFETAGGGSASAVAGYVVLAILLFMGAVQSSKTLGLEVVSGLAEELLAGLFNILVACVIFGFGLFLSRFASKAISGSGGQATVLAAVARGAILIFTGAMALFKAGLAQEIVTLAFGALIVGLALAAGLAFGLGGREEAARAITAWRERS